MSKLQSYVDLLLKWNAKINLIGRNTEAEIWSRHIEDSIQLSQYIPPAALEILDIGSGGGLPGIVLSILNPEKRITLVESDQRKAAFLRTCIRSLQLNATISTERVEALPSTQADCITARALAPLVDLLGYCDLHLKRSGVAVFPKGRAHTAEISVAEGQWSFHYKTHSSITSSDATILVVSDISKG